MKIENRRCLETGMTFSVVINSQQRFKFCNNKNKIMQKQKKIWSLYEDNALKTLRDTRKIQKWSEIAKHLEQQFGIKGKNGKRCRERYYNNLSPQLKKDIWTESQEKLLIKLHNEKGNKWAEIAKVLGRSDNAVKNHYHSKLRKGIRRINNRISTYFKNQHRILKNNVISKIVQTAQNIYHTKNQHEKLIAQSCFQMKNQILDHSEDQGELTPQQLQNIKKLVTQINSFSRTYKKKPKFSSKHHQSKFLDSSDFQNESFQISQVSQVQEASQVLNSQRDQESLQKTQKLKHKKLLSVNEKMVEQNLQKEKNNDQERNSKYQLRSRPENQIPKRKEQKKLSHITCADENESLNDSKGCFKTPNEIDNFNGPFQGIKTQENINQQFLPFSWNSSLLNCLMYQNLNNLIAFSGKDENFEKCRKIQMSPINFVMLSGSNFMFPPFFSLESQKKGYQCPKQEPPISKDAIHSQKRNFSQSFVPFRREQ